MTQADVTSLDTLELGLRTLAIGALLVWGLSFGLAEGPRRVRSAGLLFCASAIGFAFNEHGPTRALIGGLGQPLRLLSVAGVGWFWLFVRALFEDRPLDLRALGVPAVLTLSGLVGWFGPDGVQPTVWILHHALELIISGHAAWLVVRSWRSDLIDARRRLRAGIIGAMTLFVGLLAVVQVRAVLQPEAAQPRLLIAALFAVLVIAGATAFLRPREGLLGGSRRPRSLSEAATVDEALIARLRVQMTEAEAWREEGLTIGALALAVGAPEHRLRAVINRRLGYGNFTRYVNDHRVGAARAILSNPAEAGRTVASIAFDLGYGSIGPFNRAFRDVTGMTPTEWRRQALSVPLADS